MLQIDKHNNIWNDIDQANMWRPDLLLATEHEQYAGFN